MKAFFSKIWSWIVGHKVVSIIISAVLVVGITCAIVLPIALKHEHSYGTELQISDTHHYYVCECGAKKDETEHVFDKTVASSEYLKAEATATTKTQYYKSCVCGKASATEYFEIDKALANLQVSDISKTYDGTPVAEPTITFDGVGAENFAYYKGNEKLTGRPTDAGTYKVVVTVDETATHAGDRVEKEFTIAKKTVNYLEITKVYNGERGFGENAGIYCQLGVEHGVIAGDTVLLETSDDIEYNVGKYYFVRMNSTEDRDTVWLLGDDAANYDFQGNDVVGEVTVTKRPVWAENVKFTYDGYTNWTGEESPNQIVFQNMANGETMDSSFVEWTFDSKNVQATLASVTFVDEDDGRSNYEIDFSKCTASIVKRPVWAENVKFIYDGSTCWTGEESPEGIVFQNVVAGETIDSSYIEWDFRFKDVGSDLVSVDDGEYYANYDFDLSKCSASIVPRVIDNLTYAFEYNGMEYRQAVISRNEHTGIVYDEQITLEVCFATPDVNALLDTSEETGFEPSFVEENYVLGENYKFSIIKKVVTKLPDTLTAEYKSTYGLLEGLEAPVEIDGVEATLIFVARKSDNNMLYNPGKYTNATITKASLGDNFDLQIETTAKYTITVNPKKLPVLDIKITEAQYNKGEFTLVSSKDGVYVPVNVTFSMANDQDVAVGAVFDLIIDEDNFMQGREVIAFADSEYAKAYQFVPDANGIVGTITIVENCDVQYDGSCNCGTSHLTETLTFTGGEAVGNSATIACDSTYEGGIYKIVLEGGKYEFFGTDQFFNISGIYDVNGNKIASSIGTYILPKGTYYFHVYVGSSPSSDTIWVKKTAEYCSFETARVFECQTDETDSFTLSGGDKLYLKIMGGANSKLNDFEIDSEATFTLEVYRLDDTATPSYVEEEALSNYYWDICNTSDFYVVLTCVTAGDISLSAAK